MCSRCEAESRTFALERAAAWRDLAPDLEVYEQGADGSRATHLTGAPPAPLLRLGDSPRPVAPDRPTYLTPSAEATRLDYWSPPDAAWRQRRAR